MVKIKARYYDTQYGRITGQGVGVIEKDKTGSVGRKRRRGRATLRYYTVLGE